MLSITGGALDDLPPPDWLEAPRLMAPGRVALSASRRPHRQLQISFNATVVVVVVDP